MPVYLKDGKPLLVDGKVAFDSACCCNVPHCPCIFSIMAGPCCSEDNFPNCTDTLLSDTDCPDPTTPPFCIGSPTVDYFTTRYKTTTVTNTGCDRGYTGSCTVVFGTDPETCEGTYLCSGR